jgi:hypothetical protein
MDLIAQFELNFVIRVSQTDYKKEVNEGSFPYSQLLKKIRRGKFIDIPVTIGDIPLRLIGKRIDQPEKNQDDLLIVISNLSLKPARIIQIYGIRWQIECMFKCLKTNGFNLEDMGFRNPQKIRLLVYIVIACLLCFMCL